MRDHQPKYLNRNAAFSNPTAFTLFELLVVIAIISILAALLLPVISRSKIKARQIACVGNLHQLGFGLQNFVAANHAYPSIAGSPGSENPGFWISQLASGGFDNSRPVTNLIESGVWRCPSAPSTIKLPNKDIPFCSYGYNAYGVASVGYATNALGLHGGIAPGANYLSGHDGFTPVQESEVATPSEMMVIGDSIVGGVVFMRKELTYLDNEGRATARHQGRVNVLFCDGHAESPTLKFVFEDTSDAALVRWNRDHQTHRDRL